MDLQSLPHLSWTEFTRTVLPALTAVPREDSAQYVLCPYDPTVIRAPRKRSNRRPAALAVPTSMR